MDYTIYFNNFKGCFQFDCLIKRDNCMKEYNEMKKKQQEEIPVNAIKTFISNKKDNIISECNTMFINNAPKLDLIIDIYNKEHTNESLDTHTIYDTFNGNNGKNAGIFNNSDFAKETGIKYNLVATYRDKLVVPCSSLYLIKKNEM